MDFGIIIGIIGVILTLGVFIFAYIITHHLQIRAYRTQKASEQLFKLHFDWYSHLAFSAFRLSEWIVIGLADYSTKGNLSKGAFQGISYYLAYFLNHRKRLFKYTTGFYDLEEQDNQYYVGKLLEEIERELRKDFDKDDFKKLTELCDDDSFDGFNFSLADSLPDKTKRAIEKLVRSRAEGIEKLLKLYSLILVQDRYSLYGMKVDNRYIKLLHKQAKYILFKADKERRKIEIDGEKLKKDCELLMGVVNELRSKGYEDNQVSTTKYLREEILVFEKNKLNRFLFRKSFPWIVSVKKRIKWQNLPVELFQYTTKFKYIKQALTESQKLKERLDKKLKKLYAKEIKYVLTMGDCVFIIVGVVTSFLGFIVASGRTGLLKIVSDYKLEVIGIILLLGGIICLLNICIMFLKTMKKEL
jgi:hypothetical protein